MKTKKFLGSILTSLVLLFTSFVFVACGDGAAVKFASIEGLATEVCVGENYDTSKAKVKIEFESGNTTEVTASDLTFSELDTSTPGENKILRISYTKDDVTISYDFKVTVYVDYVTTINSVSGLRTTVNVGETYQTANASANVTYKSGKTGTISTGLTFGTVDTSVAGNVSLTVSYGTVTYNLPITVYAVDTITNQVVTNGSYQTELDFGETFNKNTITMTVTYSGGRTEVIDSNYLTISDLDMYNFNTQTFTATYALGNEEFSAQGSVKINKTYMILGFDNPAFVDAYETNSTKQNTFDKTGSNGVKGFTDTNNQFLVGTFNEFVFEPRLSVFKANGTRGLLSEYKVAYRVFLLEGGQYTELSGNTLASYVTINDNEHTLKFNATAGDRTFKISALPAFVDQDDSDEITASEFVFTVKAGYYNVYTTADLSVFDNVNYENKWTTYKQANGIQLNMNITGLALQNDIRIMPEDIPAMHKYQDSEVPASATNRDQIVGSLKDDDTGYNGIGIIYGRIGAKETNFVIEGNYFQIAGDNIPLIVDDDYSGDSYNTETMIVVNSALFGFFGEYYGESDTKEASKFTSYEINNIELNGNTKKSEGIGGGIIFMKKENCEVNVYNTLSTRWYMSFMSRKHFESDVYGEDGENVPLNLDKVNAFDAYNCLIYMSAGTANITDCKLIGAGGPVMICDQSYLGDNDEIVVITSVNVDTDSVLESFVSGEEAWFVSFKAAEYAGMLKAMLQYYTQVPTDTTLQTKDYFATQTQINLVAVYKSGKTSGIDGSAVRGYFDQDGKNFGLDAARTIPSTFIDLAAKMHMFDEAAATMGTTAAVLAEMIKSQSPVIQTFDGSFGFVGQNGQWANEALSPTAIKNAITYYKDNIISAYVEMLKDEYREAAGLDKDAEVPQPVVEYMTQQATTLITALADATYANAQKYLALYLPQSMTGMNIVVGAVGTKTVA